MAKKEFSYCGKSLEDLKSMPLSELVKILPSPARRKIQRGFTDYEKTLLKNLRASPTKTVKTHCRTMVILPEMVNRTIGIHNGKTFELVLIQPEMIGHRLGEFQNTRKRLTHSAPGLPAPDKN